MKVWYFILLAITLQLHSMEQPPSEKLKDIEFIKDFAVFLQERMKNNQAILKMIKISPKLKGLKREKAIKIIAFFAAKKIWNSSDQKYTSDDAIAKLVKPFFLKYSDVIAYEIKKNNQEVNEFEQKEHKLLEKLQRIKKQKMRKLKKNSLLELLSKRLDNNKDLQENHYIRDYKIPPTKNLKTILTQYPLILEPTLTYETPNEINQEVAPHSPDTPPSSPKNPIPEKENKKSYLEKLISLFRKKPKSRDRSLSTTSSTYSTISSISTLSNTSSKDQTPTTPNDVKTYSRPQTPATPIPGGKVRKKLRDEQIKRDKDFEEMVKSLTMTNSQKNCTKINENYFKCSLDKNSLN